VAVENRPSFAAERQHGRSFSSHEEGDAVPPDLFPRFSGRHRIVII
jgi:hypothetical protein